MNKDYLYDGCKQAFNSAEENGYVDRNFTSPAQIEEVAYEVLQFGFEDVDGLSEEEYDKCVEILKSFLA